MRILAMTALVMVGCGGPGKPTATPTPSPTTAPTAAPADVLVGLENGDRACYVVVRRAGGEQRQEGDFALCGGGEHDASQLIGKPVRLKTRKAKVLAASCEGDMDCGKSDEVDLVVAIDALP